MKVQVRILNLNEKYSAISERRWRYHQNELLETVPKYVPDGELMRVNIDVTLFFANSRRIARFHDESTIFLIVFTNLSLCEYDYH